MALDATRDAIRMLAGLTSYVEATRRLRAHAADAPEDDLAREIICEDSLRLAYDRVASRPLDDAARAFNVVVGMVAPRLEASRAATDAPNWIFFALMLKRAHRRLSLRDDDEHGVAEDVVSSVARLERSPARAEREYALDMQDVANKRSARWTRAERVDPSDDVEFLRVFARENLERTRLTSGAFRERFQRSRARVSPYHELDDNFPLSAPCPTLRETTRGGVSEVAVLAEVADCVADVECARDELREWTRALDGRPQALCRWLERLGAALETYCGWLELWLAANQFPPVDVDT